jgi:beta-glucosidase
MTAYSRLHGVNCAENRWLVKDISKGEWAYPGVVISDWRAITTTAAYASGIDLEMPGPGTLLAPEAVCSALQAGLITEQEIHDRGTRVLNLLRQLAQTAGTGPDHLLDAPEHRETARRVAEESIVLLKNQNGLLPLNPDRLTTLAVIGPNAAEARLGGGGSASVTPPYSISLLRGLHNACGDRINISYEEGCGLVGTMDVIHGCFEHIDTDGRTAPGLLASFYNNGVPDGAPDDAWAVDRVDFSWGWASPGGRVGRVEYAARFAGRMVPRHSGLHRFALYGQEGDIRLRINDTWLIDQWNGNGNFEDTYATKYQTVSLELTAGQPVDIEIQYKKRAARAAVRLEWEEPGVPSPIDRAVDLARRTEVVVLCLGLSNLFEGGSRDRKDMNLPDVQLELLRRVRAVNPNVIVVLNNGGPLVMPWADQVPAILEAWYPGQEGGSALARILLGEVNPSGKLPDTIPFRLEDHASMANYPGRNGEVRYEEGLMIGYRHFDHAGIAPHFPFGFGLSYTTFEIGTPKIETEDDVTVSVMVTNTGSRDGAETVQVYVAPLNPPVLRPPQELKAFRKVTLNAGESRDLTFKLLREDFAYWDESRKDWTVASGDYEIRAGSHSRDFRSVQVHLA